MDRKREEARLANEEAQRARHAKARAAEVIPFLRKLQISDRDARRAAELCENIPDAPLEERVRRALSCFGRGVKLVPQVAFRGP